MIYTIYKISCKNKNIKDSYIGSTQYFKKRCHVHKNISKSPHNPNYNLKLYQSIRNNGGFDNWDIKKICEVNIQSKNEIFKIENLYCKIYNSTLNKNICGRDHKMYYEDNKDKYKEYYRTNKLKILKRQKEYIKKKKQIIK